MAFQIFTDSSSGMSKELRKKLNVEYFRMGVIVNETEYHADLNYEEYSNDQMYEWVKDPKTRLKTSLIAIPEFVERCEPFLKKGIDILYIGCTDALSGSRALFEVAVEDLRKQYPDRKLVSINSKRAEMALGMIVIEACKRRDEGMSMDEVINWVNDNIQTFHMVGSVGTLSYLKAAGRVSGAAAFFGNMISLKPMIMADVHGHNYVYAKVKGVKQSLDESFEYIKRHMVEGLTDTVWVCQAQCVDKQQYLKKRIEEELHLHVEEGVIGPIVGISCGPGMFGCFFRGDTVTTDSEKK